MVPTNFLSSVSFSNTGVWSAAKVNRGAALLLFQTSKLASAPSTGYQVLSSSGNASRESTGSYWSRQFSLATQNAGYADSLAQQLVSYSVLVIRMLQSEAKRWKQTKILDMLMQSVERVGVVRTDRNWSAFAYIQKDLFIERKKRCFHMAASAFAFPVIKLQDHQWTFRSKIKLIVHQNEERVRVSLWVFS